MSTTTQSDPTVPGYWTVNGVTRPASSPHAAKRAMIAFNGARGGVHNMTARLATQSEVDAYMARMKEEKEERERRETSAEHRDELAGRQLAITLGLRIVQWDEVNSVARYWSQYGIKTHAELARLARQILAGETVTPIPTDS